MTGEVEASYLRYLPAYSRHSRLAARARPPQPGTRLRLGIGRFVGMGGEERPHFRPPHRP